jgi:hypothetical protein
MGSFEKLTTSHSTLFWMAIIASIGWILLAIGNSQTRIDPNQIRLNLPPVAAVIRAEALVPQSPDGSYKLPIPVTPPGTNQSVTVTIWAVNVFRNNVKQNGGSDYNFDPANGFHFTPSTAWLPSDAVLVDYWSGAYQPIPLPAQTARPTALQKLGRFLKREYPNK